MVLLNYRGVRSITAIHQRSARPDQLHCQQGGNDFGG
jgi:hypothetical protein